MNRIALFVLSGAMFPLLFDSALKGTVLLIVASGLALLLWKASAARRHLVWQVAIPALLIMPLLSVALPQWRILPRWAESPPLESRSSPTVGTSLPAPPSLPAAAPPADASNPIAEPATLPRAVPALPSAPAPEISESSPAAPPTDPAAEEQLAFSWRDWLPLVWTTVFFLLLLRLLAAHFLLRRACFRSEEISDANPGHQTISEIFGRCLREIGVRQRVKLLVDPGRPIPIAWGVMRPRILLPAEALTWDEDQVRSVLLHELAHLKRRDPLVQWLTQLACALHWWNPLVWFAAWRVHVERERACDDLVLTSGVRPSMYAEHLLHVASQLSPSPWTHGCGLAMARKSSLEVRLLAVLSDRLSRRGVGRGMGIAGLLVGISLAIPMAMLSEAENAEPDAEPEAAASRAAPVTKKPLRPGAYHRMDQSLLRRWEMLEGSSDPVPEHHLAGLRSAIARFIDGIDASPYSLSAKQIKELRALQVKDANRESHPAEAASKFVKAVFAIHGEPIQMAFNELPWPGRVRPLEHLEELPFGPAAPDGLRVALLCEKKQFIFGDTARLDLHLWNTGDKTLILGIGRDAPGLYPKLDLRATGRNGREVKIEFGPEGEMLKDIKFTKTWQLRPGESTGIYGHFLKVGPGESRASTTRPLWYTRWYLPDVQSGEEITLSASLPYPHAPGKKPAVATVQTGERTISAIAPADIEIWSASGAGKWPMPEGVTLEVKQECFHGADVMSSAVLTWPKDATGTTRACTIGLAADAFGNREPWSLAWENNKNVLWTMTGQMGTWQQIKTGLAVPYSVRRIDFSDRMKIVTTSWSHFPKELPRGIRKQFLTTFKPLPDKPRNAKDAEGHNHSIRSHDVRPIELLLNGKWKNKGGKIDVQITFPENTSGKIQWALNFNQTEGSAAVSANLSRIRRPAENAIGLWLSSDPRGHLDEEDILGGIRRGPNDTLLLDIKETDKHPAYHATTGIVLERVPK